MEQNNSAASANNLYNRPNEEIAAYLGREIGKIKIPPSVEGPADMQYCAELLSVCATWYSFLMNMKLQANMEKRRMKRQKMDKDMIEDALIREEIFETYCRIVDNNYTAISRLVSIHSQSISEMRYMHDLP